MLVRCLLAMTFVLPAASVAQPDSSRVEPFEGVGLRPGENGAPPRAVRFEFIPDSGVVFESLGAVEIDVSPDPLSGLPPLPESDPESSVLVPEGVFLSVAKRVNAEISKGDPMTQFGFSIADGSFRLSFDQGVPLLTLALVGVLMAVLAGALVSAVFLLRERRRKGDHLRLQRRQSEAREAERARLAREIHDGPLQDLHALRATLATPGGDGAPVRPVSSGIPSLDEGIGDVAHELRAIAEGLRPPALGRFGLAAALGAHATRFRERHPHVEVRLALDDDGGPSGSRLSEPSRATLFRIAQEAMSNAVQHGEAQAVDVRFALLPSSDTPEQVVLEVCDDGKGLGTTPDLDTLVADGHFGLVGMHERAALLDGTLYLGPAPATSEPTGRPGTTVRLTAPWDSVTAEATA
ncbi:MAG: ATP-binding protein [Bacteroidota bacterium]